MALMLLRRPQLAGQSGRANRDDLWRAAQIFHSLTNGDLEKTVQVHVAGQCLVVTRTDEGDEDDPPILDTGAAYVEMTVGCE
jgi:hypothetical protein